MKTKLHEIAQLGQSLWIDNISRSMIKSGKLKSLIDQGLRGQTSNPTIFKQAITPAVITILKFSNWPKRVNLLLKFMMN